MIKISIIIPIYNAEKYLPEALASACQQTLTDIEILCLDDGSTDSSLAIVNSYSQKDARIKVLHKRNTGYGHTMNVGLDNAKGKYIAILEADDYLLPDFCTNLYEAAEKSKAQIIRADFGKFYDNSNERKIIKCAITQPALYGKVCNPQTLDIRIFRSPMMSWTGLVLRSFLQQYRIRHHETPGAAYQDNGFWFQLFCQATKVFYLPRTCYMYRIDNPKSSCHNRSRLFSMNEEYAFIYGFLKQNIKLHKFLGIYWFKKYENNLFTLRRISPEHQAIYLSHFHEEFLTAQVKNELQPELFTAEEWQDVETLLNEPNAYLEKLLAAKFGYAYEANIKYPAISVVVKAGATTPHLQRCLKSLQQQTYRNFEILLFDEGLSQEVSSLCKFYGTQDGFHYLQPPACALYQEILKQTHGQYITFIDGSDFVNSDFLETLYSFAKFEQLELVSCGYTYITNQAKQEIPADAPPIKVSGKINERMQFEMKFSAWGVLWGKLYHRNLLTKVWWQIFTAKRVLDERLLVFSAAVLADGYLILQQELYQRQYQPIAFLPENLPAGLTLLWQLAMHFNSPTLLPQWGQYFLGQYWEENLAAKYPQTTLGKTQDLAMTNYLQFIKEML